jgi:hypothetical protein
MLGFCIISTSNSKRKSARAKDKASGAKEENVSAHKRMPSLGCADQGQGMHGAALRSRLK